MRLKLNPAADRMRQFSARENELTLLVDRATSEKKVVIDARLGDPNRHGLHPYSGYLSALRDIVVAELEGGLGSIRELEGLDSAHQYTESAGFPPLKALLAKECGLKTTDIFMGGGESGIARSVFEAMLLPGEESVVPIWTYVMYYSETMRREATIVSVKLDDHGEPDLDQLRDSITEKTKCVNITTVSNPMGIGSKLETMRKIIRIVNEKEQQFGNPIFLHVDTEYEGFRNKREERIDPIELSREEGRVGPTIEFYSASKMLGIPGDRIGWAKVYWNDEHFKEEKTAFYTCLNRMGVGLLGDTASLIQVALYLTFHRINTNELERKKFEEFKAQRREIVSSRTHNFLQGVASIDGVVLPKYYYVEGRIPRRIIDSFYVMFGIDERIFPRGSMPQAAALAQFAYDNGLPIPALSPDYHFIPNGLEGLLDGQELMRAVALLAEPKLDMFLDVFERFVKHLKKAR